MDLKDFDILQMSYEESLDKNFAYLHQINKD